MGKDSAVAKAADMPRAEPEAPRREKVCFVIAPIGGEESLTRKRSDQIQRLLICPSVEPLGYKVVRADQIPKPGMITSQIIERILNAELVVADLTERNPNVFYEVAIRHAIRKPLVQIIEKDEVIPFDVAQSRTVRVDTHDWDSLGRARLELAEQVKAVERDPSLVDNPISQTIDLLRLGEGSPERKWVPTVLNAISDLTEKVSALQFETRYSGFGLPPAFRLDLRAKQAFGILSEGVMSPEGAGYLSQGVPAPSGVIGKPVAAPEGEGGEAGREG